MAVRQRCPLTGSCVRTDIPVGDATASDAFRTRLETRTKESSMCASHWDFFSGKPRGAMKVKIGLFGSIEGGWLFVIL